MDRSGSMPIAEHTDELLGKSDPIWTLQVVRLPYGDEPLSVLEERTDPASECTIEVARVIFMARFEGPGYMVGQRRLKPDAVRVLDENGAEVLRYTVWNYFREVTEREAAHDDLS